jgi:hypothetical protein
MSFFPNGDREVGVPISPEVIERFGEIVPVMVEEAWNGPGAVTSNNGFIRLIDPAALLPVMDVILPTHPNAIPTFATAWGDLVVQHEDSYLLVLYRFGFFTEFIDMAADFVFDLLDEPEQQETALQRLFFDEAVAALGMPAIDECFGFKLPLAMGGPDTVDNVAIRKLKEHLVFLVQTSGAPKDLDELDPPEQSA